MHIIFIYNTVILFFNFLPIWPLDGGKLLFIFLCLIFPYRLAYSTILIVAMYLCIVLFLSQLLFFSFTLSAIIIFAYLLLRNITEWKQRFFVFKIGRASCRERVYVSVVVGSLNEKEK